MMDKITFETEGNLNLVVC